MLYTYSMRGFLIKNKKQDSLGESCTGEKPGSRLWVTPLLWFVRDFHQLGEFARMVQVKPGPFVVERKDYLSIVVDGQAHRHPEGLYSEVKFHEAEETFRA
jgi:hypothetical protein